MRTRVATTMTIVTTASMLGAALLGACANSGTTSNGIVSAPVAIVIPPLGDGGAPPSFARTKPVCTMAFIVTGMIKRPSTCFVDHKIEGRTGTLEYPCDGDGAVEARFDRERDHDMDHDPGRGRVAPRERGSAEGENIVYEGTKTGDRFTLQASTKLDWDADGCTWGTKGTLEGSLKSFKLEWRYSDFVIDAHGKSCSGECRANATIVLRPDGAAHGASPDADEDESD